MEDIASKRHVEIPTCDERRVVTSDGIDLHVRHYAPSLTPARRTLLIVHGVCEHGGRYEHVATAAAQQGWETIIPDLRGHGRSSGPRAHVSRFTDYVDDIETVRREFQTDPQKTAMLGHSMGGLVAIRYAQRHSDQLSALALSAPFLRPGKPPHPVTTAFGRVMSLIAPRTRFATRIEPHEVCRDPLMLKRRAEDQLMQTSVTAGWFFEARFAIGKAWKRAERMQMPLLVMQGAMDCVVDPLSSERWAESSGSTDKTFELFPDHMHELLNEPDRDETIDSLLGWLDARVA